MSKADATTTPDDDWLFPLEMIRTGRGGAAGGAFFDSELASVERGSATYRLTVSARTAGGAAGGVHGGLLAALIDMAVTTATATVCKRGDVMRGTAELNISYLRPAVGRELLASATIVKKGRTLAVGQVDIHNDAGELVATGRVTYALGRAEAE